MSTKSSTGLESCPTNAELAQTVNTLQSELEAERAARQELEDTVSEQADEIGELREQVERAEASRGHIIDDILELEGRTEQLEAGFEDKKGGCETGESGSPDLYQPESPLEQITNLPEHLAGDQLTENQERARFIAKDIQDYGDMRLGEYVLSTGDIRKVLAAKEESTIHWQTVSRVVEYLNQMGKDDTRVKDKHGTIVCFDPEAAKRFGTQQVTPVVTGQTGKV